MNETSIAGSEPTARLERFIVQEMIHRPGAYELIAGVSSRPHLWPGDPVRPRRHRGRDPARQVARTAAAQHGAGARAIERTRIAACSRAIATGRRRHRWRRERAGAAWPNRGRPCRDHRDRHQSAALRRTGGDRRRLPHRVRAATASGAVAARIRPYPAAARNRGSAPPDGSVSPCGRSARKTSRRCAASSRRWIARTYDMDFLRHYATGPMRRRHAHRVGPV